MASLFCHVNAYFITYMHAHTHTHSMNQTHEIHRVLPLFFFFFFFLFFLTLSIIFYSSSFGSCELHVCVFFSEKAAMSVNLVNSNKVQQQQQQHRRVLAKAQACGITGTLLSWLQDYLKDRSLQAVICGQESALYPISAGVPQGSILGPTLFILYVNDCADHLPGGPSLALYADDTTLYKYITCIDDIHGSSTQLQSAVDAVAAWGQSWKIQFEPNKSQALTLSCHRPPLVLPLISFNNVLVAERDDIRLLSVIFIASSPSDLISCSIASKANQRLHFCKKVTPLLNVAGKLCLYEGILLSWLQDYLKDRSLQAVICGQERGW